MTRIEYNHSEGGSDGSKSLHEVINISDERYVEIYRAVVESIEINAKKHSGRNNEISNVEINLSSIIEKLDLQFKNENEFIFAIFILGKEVGRNDTMIEVDASIRFATLLGMKMVPINAVMTMDREEKKDDEKGVKN